MKKVINVTQRDIDFVGSKEYKDCLTQCAVARAVRRHKIFADASVGYRYISNVNIPGYNSSLIELPAGIAEKIKNIILGSPVSPFKFTIEVPDNVI